MSLKTPSSAKRKMKVRTKVVVRAPQRKAVAVKGVQAVGGYHTRVSRVLTNHPASLAFAKGLAQLVTLGFVAGERRRRISIAEAMARDWNVVGRDLSAAFDRVKSAGSA